MQWTPPIEFKFSGSGNSGLIAGYGAVFGNVDDGGDLIEPGAFKNSLAAMRVARMQPDMLLMHGIVSGIGFDSIGAWHDVREDAKGLAVEGAVDTTTETGRRILGMIAMGTLTGLSIGYVARRKRSGAGVYGLPRRILEEIDLREISLVTVPMNRRAVFQSPGQMRSDAAAAKVLEALRDLGNAAVKALERG